MTTRRRLVNHSLLALASAILAGCALFEGSPAFTKPRAKDVSGAYSVDRASWTIPGRREIKQISIKIEDNGNYQVAGVPATFSSPLIPGTSGHWALVPKNGLDPGSRPSWGIRFSPKDGAEREAFCLGTGAPYELILMDYSRRKQGGEYVVFKKTAIKNE